MGETIGPIGGLPDLAGFLVVPAVGWIPFAGPAADGEADGDFAGALFFTTGIGAGTPAPIFAVPEFGLRLDFAALVAGLASTFALDAPVPGVAMAVSAVDGDFGLASTVDCAAGEEGTDADVVPFGGVVELFPAASAAASGLGGTPGSR